MDYYSISDNGDREKILATVVSCLYAFFNEYPGVYVYATGSTPVRTRLYRIGISKHYKLIEDDFNVFGELERRLGTFSKKQTIQSIYGIFKTQRMKLLNISKIDTKRKPVVTIDESLDSCIDMVSNNKKNKQANRMLAKNNFFEKMKGKETITPPRTNSKGK